MITDVVKASKFLSLVLRHKPEEVGITLDAHGWVEVAVLLEAVKDKFDRAMLDRVVAENNKKRFEFSEDGLRIRASQGHSVDVDLGYAPAEPPEFLYHGTAVQHLDSIRTTGLDKRSRHAVHLSVDEATARSVGSRHGRPVILRVRARDLAAAGAVFYRSTNGVWLTDAVPAEYLVLLNSEGGAVVQPPHSKA
jgi:putative RNA 2'-phosphotransferase